VLYIVIIAGGKGERFWPKSVKAMPKQFHRIVTERTMIQETFHRIYPEVDRDRIFVAAGAHLRDIILEQLPELDERNLIVEPVGKNTAPAIGLSAAVIGNLDAEAVIAVLSADHVVETKEGFLAALQDAERAAERGYIVTFGIEPTRPATEFGYIEVGNALSGDFKHEVYAVRRFREKPSLKRAREYIEAGTFFWNSGMFIFRVTALLDAMAEHMPSLYSGLMRIQESLDTGREERVKREEFDGFESVSIDYGIMEKSDRIACLKPRFVWDDVGSWSALERHRKGDENGNMHEGNIITVDSADSIVFGDSDSIIALVGMRNVIVVKEGKRILVCRKGSDQKVKEALKRIAENEANVKYL